MFSPFKYFAILATILLFFTGCAGASVSAPGMIVHFGNDTMGKSIILRRSVSSSGLPFSNPGAISPSSDPLEDGKVMGAAPDGRSLPEWVEFTWFETEYPETINRSFEQLSALPNKIARISVRERIPVDVVNSVVRSKGQPILKGRPPLKLWVYFIWSESSIKFRWSEVEGCCTVLRSGGDRIDKN